MTSASEYGAMTGQTWVNADASPTPPDVIDVVNQFLQKEDMDLAVRAHQVVEDGYEFFANRQLVFFSVLSCGGEFNNAGPILTID